jgi:hypothetical protein
MTEVGAAPALRYRVFGRDRDFDRNEMRELIRQGEVTSLTDVAISGEDNWRGAGFYPELQKWLALAARSKAPARPAATPAAVKGSSSTVQLVVGTLLIVIGIVFGASGASDVVHGLSSSRWPSTSDASLLDAQLVRHRTRSRGRARTRYSVAATYRYSVDGRKYLGQKVSFGKEWTTTAQTQLSQIQSEQPFHVYYDPGNPRTAVLRPGMTIGALSTVALALAGVIAGVLLLFLPGLAARLSETISAASKMRLGR